MPRSRQPNLHAGPPPPSAIINWRLGLRRATSARNGSRGVSSAAETADQPDVGVREALEEVQAACRDLARLKDVDEIAEMALGLALSLTRSTVVFMGLTDQSGSYEHVYSRSADASRKAPPDEAERLIAGGVSASNPAVCAKLLEAAGETVGMIGVARELNYTQLHRQVLGILASQVAASVQSAQLRMRRQEMVDTLINLRADLERPAHPIAMTCRAGSSSRTSSTLPTRATGRRSPRGCWVRSACRMPSACPGVRVIRGSASWPPTTPNGPGDSRARTPGCFNRQDWRPASSAS